MSRFGLESEKFHIACWSSIGRFRIFLSKNSGLILVNDTFLLLSFVTMLLVCVNGFLPKCSNGVILVVFLGISFKFLMIADIFVANLSFDQFLPIFIAARLLLWFGSFFLSSQFLQNLQGGENQFFVVVFAENTIIF